MTFLEKISMLERIVQLIRMKATGSPVDLANRLQCSERHVYYIITLMKDLGAPIYYCSDRQSYCYETDINFHFGFEPIRIVDKSVKGGSHKNEMILMEYFGTIFHKFLLRN